MFAEQGVRRYFSWLKQIHHLVLQLSNLTHDNPGLFHCPDQQLTALGYTQPYKGYTQP